MGRDPLPVTGRVGRAVRETSRRQQCAPMRHWVHPTHRTPHWVHLTHPMPHWGATRHPLNRGLRATPSAQPRPALPAIRSTEAPSAQRGPRAARHPLNRGPRIDLGSEPGTTADLAGAGTWRAAADLAGPRNLARDCRLGRAPEPGARLPTWPGAGIWGTAAEPSGGRNLNSPEPKNPHSFPPGKHRPAGGISLRPGACFLRARRTGFRAPELRRGSERLVRPFPK